MDSKYKVTATRLRRKGEERAHYRVPHGRTPRHTGRRGGMSDGYPALRLWQDELRGRYKSQRPEDPRTWILDALWRAAAYEAAALEAEAEGLSGADDKRRAREVVIQAARAKKAQAVQ